MDVAALINSFKTGTYAVRRQLAGQVLRGRVATGTVSALSIAAAVQPAQGEDLLRLPEGRTTDEARVLFTASQLFVGGQGATYAPDVVTISGRSWQVEHVEVWTDGTSGRVGYRCIVRAT